MQRHAKFSNNSFNQQQNKQIGKHNAKVNDAILKQKAQEIINCYKITKNWNSACSLVGLDEQMSQAFNAKIQQAFKGSGGKAMSAFTLLQLITVTLAAINAVEGLGVSGQKAGELELSDGFGSEFGGNSLLDDIKHHRELNENLDNTVKQT